MTQLRISVRDHVRKINDRAAELQSSGPQSRVSSPTTTRPTRTSTTPAPREVPPGATTASPFEASSQRRSTTPSETLATRTTILLRNSAAKPYIPEDVSQSSCVPPRLPTSPALGSPAKWTEPAPGPAIDVPPDNSTLVVRNNDAAASDTPSPSFHAQFGRRVTQKFGHPATHGYKLPEIRKNPTVETVEVSFQRGAHPPHQEHEPDAPFWCGKPCPHHNHGTLDQSQRLLDDVSPVALPVSILETKALPAQVEPVVGGHVAWPPEPIGTVQNPPEHLPEIPQYVNLNEIRVVIRDTAESVSSEEGTTSAECAHNTSRPDTPPRQDETKEVVQLTKEHPDEIMNEGTTNVRVRRSATLPSRPGVRQSDRQNPYRRSNARGERMSSSYIGRRGASRSSWGSGTRLAIADDAHQGLSDFNQGDQLDEQAVEKSFEPVSALSTEGGAAALNLESGITCPGMVEETTISITAHTDDLEPLDHPRDFDVPERRKRFQEASPVITSVLRQSGAIDCSHTRPDTMSVPFHQFGAVSGGPAYSSLGLPQSLPSVFPPHRLEQIAMGLDLPAPAVEEPLQRPMSASPPVHAELSGHAPKMASPFFGFGQTSGIPAFGPLGQPKDLVPTALERNADSAPGIPALASPEPILETNVAHKDTLQTSMESRPASVAIRYEECGPLKAARMHGVTSIVVTRGSVSETEMSISPRDKDVYHSIGNMEALKDSVTGPKIGEANVNTVFLEVSRDSQHFRGDPSGDMVRDFELDIEEREPLPPDTSGQTSPRRIRLPAISSEIDAAGTVDPTTTLHPLSQQSISPTEPDSHGRERAPSIQLGKALKLFVPSDHVHSPGRTTEQSQDRAARASSQDDIGRVSKEQLQGTSVSASPNEENREFQTSEHRDDRLDLEHPGPDDQVDPGSSWPKSSPVVGVSDALSNSGEQLMGTEGGSPRLDRGEHFTSGEDIKVSASFEEDIVRNETSKGSTDLMKPIPSNSLGLELILSTGQPHLTDETHDQRESFDSNASVTAAPPLYDMDTQRQLLLKAMADIQHACNERQEAIEKVFSELLQDIKASTVALGTGSNLTDKLISVVERYAQTDWSIDIEGNLTVLQEGAKAGHRWEASTLTSPQPKAPAALQISHPAASRDAEVSPTEPFPQVEDRSPVTAPECSLSRLKDTTGGSILLSVLGEEDKVFHGCHVIIKPCEPRKYSVRSTSARSSSSGSDSPHRIVGLYQYTGGSEHG